MLTFFPWPSITAGTPGTGQASEIGYSVPAGSFNFWMRRFDECHVSYSLPDEHFGEPCLAFRDPDGLPLVLVVATQPEPRSP